MLDPVSSQQNEEDVGKDQVLLPIAEPLHLGFSSSLGYGDKVIEVDDRSRDS
jgi:hypothetical protein